MPRYGTVDSTRHVTENGAGVTMQDDIFPAAEKILSDIENVVKKNSSLKTFEIIPAEDNENKSPVFHHEEALGLASWCVQPLYCYAYRRLLELRQNKHRREEPSTVARWLLGALLLNPEITTFWNMRRELVKAHKLDATEELSFARLVLYHKPKCFEAFAYRRWLLSYILDAKEPNYNPGPTESLLCAELELAGTCADRYANNYHAWSHRRHVLTLRESRGHTHPTFEFEWKNSLAWCQRHVSDYSSFSYRQFLLRKCMFEARESPESLVKRAEDEYEQRREKLVEYINSNICVARGSGLLQRLPAVINEPRSIEQRTCLTALSYWTEECRANEDIIRMFMDHEASWCHRRFLAHLLMCLISSYKKYSCYRNEIADIRLRNKLIQAKDTIKNNVPDADIMTFHDFLMDDFRTRTETIGELAALRSQHEEGLVHRFFKFLTSIGFVNRS